MVGWPLRMTAASEALESTTTAPQPPTVMVAGVPFMVSEPCPVGSSRRMPALAPTVAVLVTLREAALSCVTVTVTV